MIKLEFIVQFKRLSLGMSYCISLSSCEIRKRKALKGHPHENSVVYIAKVIRACIYDGQHLSIFPDARLKAVFSKYRMPTTSPDIL
jgi:hypothetical protein